MSSYYMVAGIPCSSELYHHGIKGQKWGRRNYQNPDGSLTPAGRERYGVGKAREQLGFGKKGHLNAVNRALIKSYKKNMKRFEKNEKKIVKREQKGKDASKYVERANAYLNSAKADKDMARSYASLTKIERKAINRGYKHAYSASYFSSGRGTIYAALRDARMDANTYLAGELYKRNRTR